MYYIYKYYIYIYIYIIYSLLYFILACKYMSYLSWYNCKQVDTTQLMFFAKKTGLISYHPGPGDQRGQCLREVVLQTHPRHHRTPRDRGGRRETDDATDDADTDSGQQGNGRVGAVEVGSRCGVKSWEHMTLSVCRKLRKAVCFEIWHLWFLWWKLGSLVLV